MAEDKVSRNFRDLIVWQESIKLAKEAFVLTSRFPRNELYGLTDQIRRAAVSVPSNIAEGQARQSAAEFNHFLHIAMGSLAELETQFILAKEFDYLTEADLKKSNELILNIRRMLYGLLRTLKK